MKFDNPLKFDTISGFLSAILDVIVTIAFPILVLFLLYAGFLFIKAQGNQTQLAEAKRVFLWTLVGALLVLGASVLANAIEGTVREIRRADAPASLAATPALPALP